MEKQEKTQYNQQLSFSQTIIKMFDVKTAEARGLLVWVLLGSASFGWLARALYEFAMDIILVFKPETSNLNSHAIALFTSLFLFFTSYFFINKKFKESSRTERPIALVGPPKSKGLIFLLSSYYDRQQGKFYCKKCLERDLISNINMNEIRKKLFFTNWGPLMYTIEYHKEKLSYCWLVCSKNGSDKDYKTAELLIKKIIPNCTVIMIEIENPNIINTSPITNVILHCKSDCNIRRNEIVFDFTGGTSAMTGSMILATIDDDLLLQYLRQDRDYDLKFLLDDAGNYNKNYLTEQGYISEEKNDRLLVVKTSRKFIK